MSKKEKPVSEKAHVAPESASVFDFVYCDARRIASFLAQFDEMGSLEKIVHREGVTRQSKRGWNVNLSGGASLLGTGGQGGAAFGVTPEAGATETSERYYDPFWTNARVLLDYLEEHKLLKKETDDPGIGQFILVKGTVIFLDLGLLRGAWEKQPIQRLIRSGFESDASAPSTRRERRANAAKDKDGAPSEADALIALLSLMPHTLQARILSDGGNYWCSLDEASVVGRASDLMLKHGTMLAGEWYTLGVLDAHPYDPNYRNENGENLEQMLAPVAETAVGQMVVHLAQAIRPVMGRPSSAWGITPLLIFRNIASSSEA